MTIRVRIVAAFAIVLAVLFALGANSFRTLEAIDREADDVEQGVARTTMLAEFNGQVKTTLGTAIQFTLGEKASDLDLLKTALSRLRAVAGNLDRDLFPKSEQLDALRRDTSSFFSSTEAIIKLVTNRQKCSADLNAVVTDVQVITSAIAERASASSDLARGAFELLGGTGSSAISALRFRFSRDPADMGAARRWLDIATSRLADLVKLPSQDRRVTRFLDVLGSALARYRSDLDELNTATTEFQRVAQGWSGTSTRLLASGLAIRKASAQAQQDAVARTRMAIDKGRRLDIGLGALALIVAMYLATRLIRTIASPLVSVTEAMRRIAAGELGTAIGGMGRPDEIGKMAAAVEIFRTGLLRVQALAEEKAEEQIQKQERVSKMMTLNRTFETEVGGHTSSLSEAASEMMRAAKSLLDIAAQTSSRSAAVSSAASGASSNVRLVAASTNEMSNSLREISDEVSTSTSTAGDAVRRAQEADVNVGALIGGATKIGEVVGVIRRIAHETNLLALNATIEAARAGEAGRGFGVVAEEVKQLAVATSKATDEIGDLVNDIQQAMQAAASTIKGIVSSIGAMDENASRIACAVEEQSISIARITSSAAGAAVDAEDVTRNIVDVMTASRSTDAAARQLLASAEGVAQSTQLMHKKVVSFLSNSMAV